MKMYVAFALVALMSGCNPAIASKLDVIEAKEQAMCPIPETKLVMPCALMFALIQKIMGGGCGERTCPVRL